ncbi:MAG: hypothetical protein ACM31C_30085 [Acidobacteriota bacterium]
MRTALVAATLVLAGVAEADGSVGVVVAGDAQLQAPLTAQINTWLQQHGKRVEAAALTGESVDKLVDCFVLADLGCAQRVVDRATSDAIVYTRVDARSRGHDYEIATTWLAKGHAPVTQRTTCSDCNTDTLKITTDAMLFALASQAAAAPVAVAAATPPPPPPPAASVVAVPSEPPAAGRHGLAAGVELGDPVSATVAFFAGGWSVGAALGTGTLAGPGFEAHVDAQLVVHTLAPNVPLRVGLGGRFYNQHYQPASIDEIPDNHLGVRASVAIAYEKPQWQLYAEAAPGLDVYRSTSCTLADGPNSVCPHAQSLPVFFQLDVGLRWFFSH